MTKSKMVWRKKEKVDPITKIVKEKGITNIINDYKKQIEEFEELKNTIRDDLRIFKNLDDDWTTFEIYTYDLSTPEADIYWCDLCNKFLDEFEKFNKKYFFIELLDENIYDSKIYIDFRQTLTVFDSFNNNDWVWSYEYTEEESYDRSRCVKELSAFDSSIYNNFLHPYRNLFKN